MAGWADRFLFDKNQLDRPLGTFSGGEQARVLIARLMLRPADLLLLDEPSAGLDPITSAGLDALIKDLSRSLGFTFVIVTHELQSIFAVADRVIMLDGNSKSIIGTGRPEELRDHSPNPWVRQFFNRKAQPDTQTPTTQ